MTATLARVVTLDGKAIPSPAPSIEDAQATAPKVKKLTGSWHRPGFRSTGAEMMSRLVELKLMTLAGMKALSAILDEVPGPVCLEALDPTLFITAVDAEDTRAELLEWIGRVMDDSLLGLHSEAEAEGHVWAVRLGVRRDVEYRSPNHVATSNIDPAPGIGPDYGFGEAEIDALAQSILTGAIDNPGGGSGGATPALPDSIIRPGVSTQDAIDTPF